ncbi:RDD family protein [Bernardetia sp. OM2101]|uniref:RDD family protein n=1 Tax=Bernardetia sp. OM2101 TaxID=3344876 RepID=UPI0035CEC082
MSNILKLTKKQRSFLKESRQDPITGDAFLLGDEIVFCAECKSAFFKDSWEYMGSVHCNQSETLTSFPTHSKLKLEKEVEYEYVAADTVMRFLAFLLDAVVGILIIIFAKIMFSVFKKTSSSFDLNNLFYVYMLFRDSFLGTKSIGKKIMGFKFVHSKTQQPASFFLILIRNALYWILNVFFLLLQKDFFGLETTILGVFCLVSYNFFYVIFFIGNIFDDDENSLFDKLLKIKLVENK